MRAELLAGLLTPLAVASPKFLYDALGSKLFEAICELPEYYPTRTEAQILSAYLPAIAQATGTGMTFIDLGAGNCAKAASLFGRLRPQQYVPIDISVSFMRDALDRLQAQFTEIDMLAVGADFSSELVLPEQVSRSKRLFFYPGSSIGNFAPPEALAFLTRVHSASKDNGSSDGGILIGVDLVKEKSILDAAYDDALGVTAAFNLNLLLHLNRLLGADFDIRAWRHRAFFNPQLSRIEMHLEAKRNLAVHWDDGMRRFEAGESIHTESSYKYTRSGFLNLLEQAGFGDISVWTDPQDWFMVCHARSG